MQIGAFHEVEDGFTGRIRTASLDLAVRLVPAVTDSEGKAPDWRLHLDDPSQADSLGPRIGEGWTHDSAKVGSYIAVQFDCPVFVRPLRANLLAPRNRGEAHVLLWQRRARAAKAA